MSRMRQSHILKTLRERFGGSFICSPTNTVPKLLGALGFTESNYAQLVEQLDRMHTDGKIVVSWREDGSPGSITLPDLIPPTTVDESDAAEMHAPKGQKA